MAASDERTRALLTRLEQEAQEHPRRHAIRLAALVLVGYLYPLALLAVSFAIVSVSVIASSHNLAPWCPVPGLLQSRP